ncbi:MAG: dTDP-4-dehydrorhamnose reductase [Prevotellaceae bacterium]|jgi:dTDP-4-dehydrorhamnose reductase|nr:dTDP-4-dehydrorhamnose reductase [Prevotellaceae bacterium]
MKKILVTGANGQLGNEIRDWSSLYASSFEFIFTDVAELDITSSEAVSVFFEKAKPDFVINCAAYTAVDKAETEKELAEQINHVAVENLTKASAATGAYLIHISTDYVFDGKKNTPYHEDDDTNPQSVYGQTKRRGESSALSYAGSMVIRTGWLYSNYGNNFVKTMLHLGVDRLQAKVVFDQVGTPTNAADLAFCILSIIFKVVKQEKKFVGGLFHFSNEGVCSWYDFAVQIMKIGTRPCEALPIESSDYPTPAPRPSYSVLSKEKIKKTYDVEIAHWIDSLKRLKLFEKLRIE